MSKIQKASGLFGLVTLSCKSVVFLTGGQVRGSNHFLISECPSANDTCQWRIRNSFFQETTLTASYQACFLMLAKTSASGEE
jgi:hypothetical protein